MIRVAVIGSAGRKTDGDKLNAILYKKIVGDFIKRVLLIQEPIDLISGGAAWMDHLAVVAFLKNLLNIKSLTLYFPCEWDKENNCFIESYFGGIANYYHRKFACKIGHKRNASLKQLQKAINKGTEIIVNTKGFHARNLQVGDVDHLIAYTFGESLFEPKDGGTLHTWKNSRAKVKQHIPINLI